ncbi:DapH/DapD/GlmU-related protein [Halobacterium salinarum]|uniref:acyltransferase n=1 Tax=Halobacterium salinarum TaxID=2242 RepID=UPI00255717B2|nr:acyltransferase [Halobacterium salinarum]MDL0121104.1 DapH/DapD/GlmU-related protein [Halobacterium salinarum]MDL0135785.1 DapH/DapD/GlmU-related protein [Halobacterium salinarum]MDL0138275.1 DapH/DapD/GlmU-related protein [Halobacterium salinarum]
MADDNETNSQVHPEATLGYGYTEESADPIIGENATIRAGTVIYDDVCIGDGFITGHNALVREHTEIGDDAIIGTNTVIDGRTDIGSSVSMQTNVYVPSNTTIGSNVFLGPNAVLTNDPYPVREDVTLEGPTVRDGASIGANATILPGVTIGEGSFVAAGATVTSDVPSETLAVGTPAEHENLPDELQGANDI